MERDANSIFSWWCMNNSRSTAQRVLGEGINIDIPQDVDDISDDDIIERLETLLSFYKNKPKDEGYNYNVEY